MTIKTKRTICAALGWLCFLVMLGVIGGMELGGIPLGRGAAWAFGLELLGAAALWKAGVLRI